MTYKELFSQGERTLAEAGITEATLDARLLLEYVCGTNRNDLLVHGEWVVEPGQQVLYQEVLRKRSSRIPLQQITGKQEFMGLEFRVNEHVLIPRQDTEILVEETLKYLHDGMKVLDMCTGSGCILISLLHYSNNCEGVGVDASAEALKVAKENAEKLLGIHVCTGNEEGLAVNKDIFEADENDGNLFYRECTVSVTLIESDLFDKVTDKFDVIVSNPPYICSEVIETLEPEVREHEPRMALDGMKDGLFFYRKITQECRKYLMSGGTLLFEIGYDQAEAVSRLMEDAGFHEIEIVKDYAGLDRVVCGTLGFETLSCM